MKTSWGKTSYFTYAFVLGALFLGTFLGVGLPSISTANNTGSHDSAYLSVPACVFNQQAGRTIVNFPHTKLQGDTLSLGPILTSLQRGNYKVSLMSWDGYENRETKTDQHDEQWYVTLSDENGAIANSSLSDDLEDGLSVAVFAGIVDGDLAVSRSATSVTAKHAKLYGAYAADSFYAVCAAFDALSVPTPSPTPPSTPSPTPDPGINTENSKPVITRLGNNPVTLFVGDSYTDAGATALDQEDGNITNRIVVGGATVTATSTKGNYTITYNVLDSRGAAAVEVIRLVIVQEKLGSECKSCGGGGAPGDDPLYITNEKVNLLPSGTAVVVTWDTSVLATSRVAFGTTSVKTLTLEDNFGYSTSTAFFASTTKAHSITVENLVPNTIYYFRPTSKRDETVKERAVGIELSSMAKATTTGTDGGASSYTTSATGSGVSTTQLPGECGEYIRAYIKYGQKNDRVEVLKLQSFLRTFEGFHEVPLNGIYDGTTRDAVSVFQERHSADILSPWGLQKQTGYVYITTRRYINRRYCDFKKDFALTPSQQAEIVLYKAYIEKLRAQGIDVSASGVDVFATGTPTPPKSAWRVEDSEVIKDKTIKDNSEQATTSGDATTAVIQAFDNMLAEGDTSANPIIPSSSSKDKEDVSKIGKVAAAIASKLHPSRWIQLMLIVVLFIVGFLLYRSGSRNDRDDDEDDDSELPPFGKPTQAPMSSVPMQTTFTRKDTDIENKPPAPPPVEQQSTPVKNQPEIRKESPQNLPQQSPKREERRENNRVQEDRKGEGTQGGRREQAKITLDQLRDNLVLKRENTTIGDKKPTANDHVIHL